MKTDTLEQPAESHFQHISHTYGCLPVLILEIIPAKQRLLKVHFFFFHRKREYLIGVFKKDVYYIYMQYHMTSGIETTLTSVGTVKI